MFGQKVDVMMIMMMVIIVVMAIATKMFSQYSYVHIKRT
jgi:intracellular septation protein A